MHKTDFTKHPPRILLHPCDKEASGSWRLIEPAKALRRDAAAITIVRDYLALTDEELRTMRPDVIVVQRQISDAQIAYLQRYRKVLPSAFIVYDIDDLLWDIPEHNPAFRSIPSDIKERLAKASAFCDRIVFSTSSLLHAWVRDVGAGTDKELVVVNTYTPDWFKSEHQDGRREARSQLADQERPRIGWAGGCTHQKELDRLAPIIRATSDQFQWVFMGAMPTGCEDIAEYHPPVKIEDYPRALGALALDVAVAPFGNTDFDACKTDLRLRELGSNGTPVIHNYPHQSDHGYYCDFEFIESFLETVKEAIGPIGVPRLFARDPQANEKILSAWLPVGSKTTRKTRDSARVIKNEHVTLLGNEPTCPLSAASITVLSNDGEYPRAGVFTPMGEDTARAVYGCLPSSSSFCLPGPGVGAWVKLGVDAINRIGLPDFERFSSPVEALLDWGAWASEHGFVHLLATSAFAWAEKPQETAGTNLAEVVGWHPEMLRHYEAMSDVSNVLVKEVRCRLDIAMCVANQPKAENPEDAKPPLLLLNANQAQVANTMDLEPGRPVYVAQSASGVTEIVFPPMPNTGPFSLAHDMANLKEPLKEITQVLNLLGIRQIDVCDIDDMSVADARSIKRLIDDGFEVNDAGQFDPVETQIVFGGKEDGQ